MEGAGLLAGRSAFSSLQGQEILLYSATKRPALGSILPPVKWLPGVQREEREADHSRSSSAEVGNDGAVPPIPIRFHGVALNELSLTSSYCTREYIVIVKYRLPNLTRFEHL
jgi:hypothetical protein